MLKVEQFRLDRFVDPLYVKTGDAQLYVIGKIWQEMERNRDVKL